MIDLRSDTVTTPRPAMRRAMAEAEVGDDVYGEDPTVNRLQELLAEMVGFEAGLLMPSGTMGNLVALATHAQRGYEAILPEGAHTYDREMGGLVAVAGLIPRLVPAPLGVPEVAAVRRAARHGGIPKGVIVLENSHNIAGGTVVPLERCREIGELARKEGLPLHLDGARAFNAAVAQGVGIDVVCAPFDSASLCLSKGLAAPVGTVLLGSKAFIGRAHRHRKILGGGMRQAGVLAAAGLVAVTTMVERLGDDHRRARALAAGLAPLPSIVVDLERVQTNMVNIEVEDAHGFVADLEQRGLRCNAMSANVMRLVTHYQIDDEAIDAAIGLIAAALGQRQVAGRV